MTKKRAYALIRNLLVEIVTKIWEDSKEEFISWLKLEVGFTEEEIDELKKNDSFYEPD